MLLLNNEGLEWDNLCEIGCSAVRHSQPEPPPAPFPVLFDVRGEHVLAKPPDNVRYDIMLTCTRR